MTTPTLQEIADQYRKCQNDIFFHELMDRVCEAYPPTNLVAPETVKPHFGEKDPDPAPTPTPTTEED